ncbi:MAG: hypothetical protein K0B15_11890 [Lentimicrobium sp.]|nr:hypothetical protein [Lentimicrobium sp.]
MTQKEKEEEKRLEKTAWEYFELFMIAIFDENYELFMTKEEIYLWYRNYRELN